MSGQRSHILKMLNWREGNSLKGWLRPLHRIVTVITFEPKSVWTQTYDHLFSGTGKQKSSYFTLILLGGV